MALDPDCFAPGFGGRLTDLLKIHRDLTPSPGAPGKVSRKHQKIFFYFFENSKTKSKAEGVIIPGDPERKHMEKCDHLGGIPYHRNVVDHINSVAKKYAVKTLSFS